MFTATNEEPAFVWLATIAAPEIEVLFDDDWHLP